MNGVEFSELTAFVTVAEHRSFARAAAQLGIATSTVSQTIRALEGKLGVRLLNRTTRSVAATEVGEQLLTQLQPALDSLGRAIGGVNAFRDKPVGTLRLNVARPAAKLVLAPLIVPFLVEHPDITLDIVTADTHSDIVSGRFDAGVRVGEKIEQDMIAVRLSPPFRMVTVASPAYTASHPEIDEPDDLRAHNCIRHRWDWDRVVHPWELQRDNQRVEVPVEGSLIVNELFLALSAVLDGVGVSYLPDALVAPYIAAGRLEQVLEDWSSERSGVFLYYSGRRQVPAPLQAFIAFVRKHQNGRAFAERRESAVMEGCMA
jgi:DNA-binding transcriptional LysR family regulator